LNETDVAQPQIPGDETVAANTVDMDSLAEVLASSRNAGRQRRRLRRAGIGMALAALVTGAGFLVWSPARWLLSDMKATFSAAFWPVSVELSAPVICTGLDSKGAPEGVGESFSHAQVREAGLAVFLTYSGAMPQKTRFQMRWSSDGGVLESKVQILEREADSILLNLGHDVPPGNHKIEFLIDGRVRQSASVSVDGQAPTPQKQLRSQARTKPRHASPTPPSLAAGPQVAPADVPAAPAPEVRPGNPVESAAPQHADIVFKAGHRHALGSCRGDLKLTAESVGFTSEQHTFEFGLREVNVDADGIQGPGGRWWRFFGAERNLEQILRRWKRGELFPKTAQRQPHVVQTEPPAEAASVRVYRAAHKHRLGSCAGEIRLTAERIEFKSSQHEFKYAVGEVQIEGGGIRDAAGKTWRFDLAGEDAGKLLRAWKAGTLFLQPE
jgi:hypothetical protein